MLYIRRNLLEDRSHLFLVSTFFLITLVLLAHSRSSQMFVKWINEWINGQSKNDKTTIQGMVVSFRVSWVQEKKSSVLGKLSPFRSWPHHLRRVVILNWWDHMAFWVLPTPCHTWNVPLERMHQVSNGSHHTLGFSVVILWELLTVIHVIIQRLIIDPWSIQALSLPFRFPLPCFFSVAFQHISTIRHVTHRASESFL